MPHEKRYANTGISQICSDNLLHECNWDGVKSKKTFSTLRCLNEILFGKLKSNYLFLYDPILTQY